jgi:formylglycine-generating enzyme required for sulfatase activity
LPTEAEWEYASRGGAKSEGYKYSGSNNIDDVAWFEDNSKESAHPVGTKQPNELGIYDMTGNVREWCSDQLYMKMPVMFPDKPKPVLCRMICGSGWKNSCGGYSERGYSEPNTYVQGSVQGFRVVLPSD